MAGSHVETIDVKVLKGKKIGL